MLKSKQIEKKKRRARRIDLAVADNPRMTVEMMDHNVNNHSVSRPSFGERFKAFLLALQGRIVFFFQPTVKGYAGEIIKKPTWLMARARIDEEKILPSDNTYIVNEKSYANIAKANVQYRAMKDEYKFCKRNDKKKLNRKLKKAFLDLF